MTLPVTIYSPDQISAALLELNTYQAALRDAVVRQNKGTSATLPEPGHLLAALIASAELDAQDANALADLRKTLETLLTKAPVVHLTLAALPNSSFKQQLTSWFRTEISPDILLTFAVRSDIGGGVVLSVGSHVYDFSFKRQLLANKHRIAEIAQRV